MGVAVIEGRVEATMAPAKADQAAADLRALIHEWASRWPGHAFRLSVTVLEDDR